MKNVKINIHTFLSINLVTNLHYLLIHYVYYIVYYYLFNLQHFLTIESMILHNILITYSLLLIILIYHCII